MSTAAKWFAILFCVYLIWVALLSSAQVLRASIVIGAVVAIIALMGSMWERGRGI